MIDPRLVVIMGVLIVLAGIAAWLLMRTSAEQKAMEARLEAISVTGRPKMLLTMPSLTRRETTQKSDWKASLASLFGFDPTKTYQYTLGWPWVILIALLVGRLAVLLGSGVLGSAAWALMPFATIVISRTTFGTMVAKRLDKLRKQFPDAIGLIVRAVRVGIPVSEALRAVAKEVQAPTSGEFEKLADDIAIGTPLDTALRNMSDRNGLPEYGFFAAALSLQAQTGGSLGETLELLADVTRKRVAMQARGHALSAEARTSSMILGGLPLVSGASIYFINPGYIGILFWDESGRMVLGAALLMLLTGMFIMRLIIRKALTA